MSRNYGKILILGAKGMLGQELAPVFSDLKPILWDKENLDIMNCGEVQKKIGELKPAVIINAAAYTAVDDCETNKELANKVNGEGVRYLVDAVRGLPRLVAATGSRQQRIFVHYSTDYVFDGKKSDGYKEDDEPQNPVNFYGESKLLGEEHLRRCYLRNDCGDNISADIQYYTIRTSWLYGKNGKNFVDTILKLTETQKEIRVVNDQRGKPTYAPDLAKRTRELLEGGYPSGIYHITNETKNTGKGITWYDFAREIIRQSGKKCETIPCSSSEFPRPAKRPKWSVLVNTKIPPTRNWREALREYLH